MILTIRRYLLCGIVIEIALGAPHSDRSSHELNEDLNIVSDETDYSVEIYTYNHADCEDMENDRPNDGPIIVSVSTESEECNEEILDALMGNMTNAIEGKFANRSNTLTSHNIVCGAFYQISENSVKGKCTLYFQGTSGRTNPMNPDILFDNMVWQWLVFACVAIIATVELMSALKQIYEWKNEGELFICGDDNSSLGSRKS